MSRKNRLTCSQEDYLESIYLIRKDKGEVRITDIALFMNTSKPSANKAVLLLKEEGLIDHEKYGLISLTKKGEMLADDIYFRHKTLMDFLINTLKVDSTLAEKDACKMEHVISHETLEHLIAYLNKQRYC